MQPLSIGEPVWFISKFGDCVTGTFEGHDTIPSLRGGELVDVEICRVKSFDAFGKREASPTMCVVPEVSLRRGAPPASVA